jgi:hypothetical protein
MHKLANGIELGLISELFFDVVFNRFNVVVGHRFDGLDARSGGFVELPSNVAKRAGGAIGKRRHLGDRGFRGKRLQPLHFDDNAVANKAIFANQRPECGGLARIAAIDGRNGGELTELHGLGPFAR